MASSTPRWPRNVSSAAALYKESLVPGELVALVVLNLATFPSCLHYLTLLSPCMHTQPLFFSPFFLLILFSFLSPLSSRVSFSPPPPPFLFLIPPLCTCTSSSLSLPPSHSLPPPPLTGVVVLISITVWNASSVECNFLQVLPSGCMWGHTAEEVGFSSNFTIHPPACCISCVSVLLYMYPPHIATCIVTFDL